MSLAEKIAKSKHVKDNILVEKPPVFISTGSLSINVLFSGQLDGGIPIGKISTIAAPSSLGKCARGTEEVDIEISEEVFEKYFKNKVSFEVLDSQKIIVRVSMTDLFQAFEADLPADREQMTAMPEDVYVETPYGKTRIEILVKKPVQPWVSVYYDGSNRPIQVSPNHLFFTEAGLKLAKDCLGENILFKVGSKKVLKIEESNKHEPLYDISIWNNEATWEFKEAYYLSNGSLNHNSFVGVKVAKNAQKDHNMTVLYVDTEYAFSASFAKAVGINEDEMVVIQNNQIEEVQQILTSTVMELDPLERQKLLIIIDSWGGLVTSKTINDAQDGKDVTDMTVSKKKNNLAKILTGLGCTVFVINQVYDTFDQYNPIAMGGGKGIRFASSSVVMATSKAKSKDGADVDGFIISAKVDKGRYAVEQSKLKYMIKFSGGIHPYYGILDDAMEGGFVEKPSMGWYTRPSVENDKKWRERELWENSKEFWGPLLAMKEFREYFEKKYSFKHNEIHSDELNDIEDELDI